MKKIILYFDPTVNKILTENITEEGEKKLVLSSPKNFVYASEIVARVVTVDTEEQIPTRLDPGNDYYNIIDFQTIKADTGIYFDEQNQCYKSSAYGFVVFDGQKIRWLSPLTISKDKSKAYYSVYPTKTGKLPSYTDIEEALHGYKILARIEQQKIEEQLKAIELGNPRFTRILVAQGREPAHGHEEYFLPLINLSKKAGEIKSDGSIDFKEVGSIIEIKKYQDILRRVPAVKPADGYDVFGDKIFAEFLRHDGYYKGDNIEQGKEDENIFVSSIDGCVDVDGKKISVLPVAYIHGDVNYDTGNIDFDGSVHITGSVLPGFTVKARGDIIIEKNVDDAFIEAQGDITVKMGVVGKENVKLTANGKITVKYLLNAKVEAAGDIVIEDSIINSDVFSNSKISVIARQGKIIGGKATALYEIQVNVSGSPNETETLLSVGRNLFIEKELAAIHKEIAKWRNAVDETMRKLKVSFGEAVFDNPKEFISKLIPAKQKSCLLMLKELSANNKELKKMMEQSKEIQDKLKLEREPCIIIKNKAYPGTIISIKKNTKRLESPIDNVKYYEDPDEKIIRFSPAV
ncbi:MAG: DUF342 domain-containing protein [Spirochaetes bacterium]|nr:DUF342 domain-containing protein [Spirochaetota bacterium]HOD16637.1 FapA family protein [Spirochaetota bacterium]HPG50820.1 FapA family protein [Spirochaetota bacterium]